MKKLILLFTLFFSTQLISANSLFEQLCAFNPNWSKYQSRLPDEPAKQINSESEYVSFHLGYVIEILKENDTTHLSQELKETRASLIAELTNYKIQGRFPINFHRNERIPVFIDENDTHCAVGHLLRHTGESELARSISENDNYVWVKDIKNSEVLAWQAQSGFTLEELKLIQGAYDSYRWDALIVPNRYEIPQKPEVVTRYFETKRSSNNIKKENALPWCYGEGEDGILNGVWIQNYDEETPWILGYYEDNKRTGQWKEYYPGTNKLCRTENWRNDQLNGVRTRFNREGKVVEKILFKDGKAIKKTNHDLDQAMTFVRTPLLGDTVFTEVFTFGGSLLASGLETVHNPGGLQWFQDIELTALNSFAISAQVQQLDIRPINLRQHISHGSFPGHEIELPPSNNMAFEQFNVTTLVEYHKEGPWTYYRSFFGTPESKENISDKEAFIHNYPELGNEIHTSLQIFNQPPVFGSDSLCIEYEKDQIHKVKGYMKNTTVQLSARYSDTGGLLKCGQLNDDGFQIGKWCHYNAYQELSQIVQHIIPWRDDNDDLGRLEKH